VRISTHAGALPSWNSWGDSVHDWEPTAIVEGFGSGEQVFRDA
jgi:hypothetical protein